MSQSTTVVADKNNPGGTGGQWTNSTTGLATNVYQAADEGYPGNDSTDYAQQSGLTANQVGAAMVFKLTTISAPSAGTSQIKVRHYSQDFSRTYTYELRQGYVDESNKGTLLGSTVIDPGISGWHSDTPTLSTSAATDGSDLYVRVFVTAGGAGTTIAAITALDVLFPDAGVTGSGTAQLFTPNGIVSAVGKAFWALTGSPVLFTMTGAGVGVVESPILTAGQIVVATYAGQRHGGLVLKQFADRSVLLAIGITRVGGLWRWDNEVLVTDAIDPTTVI